jgi:hypothetical protein
MAPCWFVASALSFLGGMIATVRERRIEWRAFALAVGLLVGAAALQWAPLLLTHG